jgi:hypothetical protein
VTLRDNCDTAVTISVPYSPHTLGLVDQSPVRHPRALHASATRTPQGWILEGYPKGNMDHLYVEKSARA